MAKYLKIKSTIVLLLCYNIFIIEAIKKLAISHVLSQNFIQSQAVTEQQAFIRRCIEEPEAINLESYNLESIHHNIIKSKNIRSLSLRNNDLNDIPINMVENLPYLNCLNLSENKISIYNGRFSLIHKYLTTLDLSSQRPAEEIWSVELLDENTIDTSEYEYISFESSNMWVPNLQYIDLSGNDISTLKENFRSIFPKLTHIYLNNINALEIHPYLFNNLLPKSIRCLSLKNNKINNFTFNKLANITTLHLDSNPLEDIDIISHTLHTLSLSNCTQLNNVSLETPNLRYLDISKNYNNNFLSNITIPSYLKTLILDYNGFIQFPQLMGLPELIELSLNYNMIKSIPSYNFAHLPALEKLQLKGNKISNFNADTFIKLLNLKYLDLSHNEIQNFPSGWIFPLVNLKYLNANANQLVSISELNIYGSHVEHLYVKNNRLKEITSDDINILLPDNITIYI